MITLPVRVSLRGAEFGLRVGQTVAERAIGLLGTVLMPTARRPRAGHEYHSASARARENGSSPPEAPGRSRTGSAGGDPRSGASSPERAVAAQEAVAAERPAPAASEPPEPVPPAPGPQQPSHVDEAATVIDEVAEPGAEDGAGAEIRIAEPWEGYAQLKAADVVAGLADRDPAELAAVELYELAHRKRRTVVAAAQRELRRVQNAQ